MKFSLSLLGLLLLIAGLNACSPPVPPESKEDSYLNQQQEKQGYPILIATPQIADYGLPFCEKKYCIDVEIFSFKSQDLWFNEYVNQKIANLMTQQLGLQHKLSLQMAINEFVKMSDLWQEEHPQQAWSIYVQPRVVFQHNEIAVLEVKTQYLADNRNPQAKTFYDVIDRKRQRSIRLYDLVKPESRVDFGGYLLGEYRKWLKDKNDYQDYPEKIYWANQDWFIDEEGLAIYYRATDFNSEDQGRPLVVYLSPAQLKAWIDDKYLHDILYE